MGLQSQLNDVSSDSLPFLFLALLATFISHIRSFFLIISPSSDLDLSSPFSAKDEVQNKNEVEDEEEESVDKCVFCLSGLKESHRLRKLTCTHVFHTDCLDGWIGQMKHSCPLCRSPLGSSSRVWSHLSSWFSVR